MVLASDGTRCADERSLVRFSVSVVVEKDGRRERGSAGGGGRISFAEPLEGDRLEDWVREAVRIALVNLDAVDAPAGSMPVVPARWPGVLLHEAVGHGLEGDFNRRGTSTFSNRVGKASQFALHRCGSGKPAASRFPPLMMRALRRGRRYSSRTAFSGAIFRIKPMPGS